MGVVFRVGNNRILVWSDDHPPAHVHVSGPDLRMKVLLGQGPDDLMVLYAFDGRGRDAPLRMIRPILEAIADHWEESMAAWSAIHG